MHPCLWWHEMHIFQGHSMHHCRCLWIYIRMAWHDWYARFQRAGTVCSGMVRMICSFPKPHMYSFILITVNWPTCTYFPSLRLWYLISLQKKSHVGDASTVWNLFLFSYLANSWIHISVLFGMVDTIFFQQFTMPVMSKMHGRHLHTRRCNVKRSPEALCTRKAVPHCWKEAVQV